ncbi:tRNA (adenine(37)-N6)-methyltransferase isoform X1 [Juglans microcarpa x Juglans regia]|uniref:tRNA (adenine(37)-N6)-methyltransferase isoform X1 n=1 Tax=Juglans microcarpa x Juglans regia TaxID=2249226 RepID=UPI001B7F239F|nr:tRNA (adenine(37)-N6)-methyltransferase isoform X1 [Juglans microcarpa x Juglans regia]
MATQCLGSKCSTATIALAIAAALSASTAISLYIWRRKCRGLESKIRELQKSLKSSSEKCGAERQGRIRAQQAMRKALAYPKSDNLELSSYPMAPIGVIQSCFSTRNGTPRQPLLVPLARACLVFDPTRVPPASLEGLGEYSHCWIIYVFHLNTDLEKLWKEPSKSKFKAKVRVPRLKGRRMGVFATRSPHRPCPIGLTVAKVEAVEENMVLLSGVDLVDGTPVVDVKPYLPYCDAIERATVPKWVTEDSLLEVASVSFSEGFPSILADCWVRMGKKSLYASPEEFQSLIKQVLSWDIRSPSQRNRPYDSHVETRNGKASVSDSDSYQDEEASTPTSDQASLSFGGIIYHLNLEGLDVSYRINCDGDVIVEKVAISPDIPNSHRNRCNYSSWIDKSR